ncbi:uroporphyrinogen decarboxylase family protein [Wukongibacter baidiensis]|uniref:uroporphyrinogen decarboxylase family protein n=1 Tax=Wukongibacter baidiensis TaxID=1723361 RepID=UPI003D7F4E44
MDAIQGKPVDEIPFVPRLDLWYQGNKLQGTLPEKYKNATLTELVDDLGLGYHCVVPNFSTIEHPDDNAHVGLGLFQTKSVFYKVHVDVAHTITHNGKGETTTVYDTPHGKLTTISHLDDDMIRSGITQPHVSKPAVESVEDYKKIAYIFDHIDITPRYDYYYRIKEEIGDRGTVVGFQYEGGSAMHALMKEMCDFTKFWYDYYDHLDEMLECSESIRRVSRNILKVMADSPSDVIYVGANYDSMTTNKVFFADHITPDLKWSADYLHSKGKFCLTHSDGENDGLNEEYMKAGIDVADSVAPAPMTKLSLADYRKAYDGKICIWGGISSVAALPNSMDDKSFIKYMDDTLEQCGDGRKLILHVADSVPPQADWDRILYMIKTIREFKPKKY